MKTIYRFLKESFIPGDKPLSRQNYISVMAFLCFINILTLTLPLFYFSFTAIYARFGAGEAMAAFSIQQSFNNIFFAVPTPWLFILFIANILIMVRALKGIFPLPLSIIAGLLTYISFRALPALFVYFSGYIEMMTYNEFIASIVVGNMNIYMILLIPLTAAGLILLILPFFYLKEQEEEKAVKGINRSDYNRAQLIIHVISALIVAGYFLISHFIMDNEYNNPILIGLFSTALVIIMIINIILSILRMINSPATPLWFLLLLPASILIFTGFGLIMLFKSTKLHPVSVACVNTGFYIQVLISLWLMLSGSSKTQN